MKKTIQILKDKLADLQERNDGKLEGGFASLKGGFDLSPDSTNNNPCSNTVNCTSSTNQNACTNSGTCFM